MRRSIYAWLLALLIAGLGTWTFWPEKRSADSDSEAKSRTLFAAAGHSPQAPSAAFEHEKEIPHERPAEKLLSERQTALVGHQVGLLEAMAARARETGNLQRSSKIERERQKVFRVASRVSKDEGVDQ